MLMFSLMNFCLHLPHYLYIFSLFNIYFHLLFFPNRSISFLYFLFKFHNKLFQSFNFFSYFLCFLAREKSTRAWLRPWLRLNIYGLWTKLISLWWWCVINKQEPIEIMLHIIEEDLINVKWFRLSAGVDWG